VRENNRYRLKPNEILAIQKLREKEIRNILVIGDLHEPFCLDEYLDWCIEQYETYSCNQVIFIGDIIDNHYSSYHETFADGMGGMDELELSIQRIARWYKAFPEAKIILGNHDRMIMRKSQTSAIPSKWIRSYKDVLEVPKWEFLDHYIQDGVLYQHGEGGTARTACRNHMINVVQGHLHTQCYIEHYVGKNFRVFGMQLGCGIDFSTYAMAYAKYGKKPAISCGVVLDNGSLPINLLMPL
jgi:metallophosphoesterase superfamily enzyme